MSASGWLRHTPVDDRRLGRITAGALLAAIFGTALASVTLAPQAGTVTSWYPAAGLGIALLVIAPREWWAILTPAIALAGGAASVIAGRDLGPTIGFAIGNALEAVVAASVICGPTRATRHPDAVEDLVRVVLGATLGAVAAAGVAVVTGVAVGRDDLLALARTFFTSHAAATVIVVPAVLTVAAGLGPVRRRWEIVVQVAALLAMTLVAFWPGQGLSVTFLPLPMLVWAALRLDVRVLTWELVGFSAVVTMMSSWGGPFAHDLESHEVSASGAGVLVQGYLICAVLLTLPLAVAVEQRRQLIAELGRSQKLTEATLDTAAALILVTELNGRVVRVNEATTALTGYPETELVGRDIGDLPFAPPGATGFPAGLPDDVHDRVGRETDVVTRNGAKHRVLWNTSFVSDESDRPTHVVITGTDLTAERAAAGLNRHLLEAAMTTALIGIDPSGRITVFNPGAVHILGYDAQDMIGTAFLDLLDPTQVAQRSRGATGDTAFARLVASLRTVEANRAQDWTWVGHDGRRHTVSMSIGVAADAIAAQEGYLCVGRDVTEARASQELLVAALEKERVAADGLRQVDAAKNEFVSTVSHELRTPVASIVGYTEMLQDGSVDEPTPTQRRLLGSIERSGHRLIALCDDLLTLGSLDAGMTQWKHAPVDLAELVAGSADALRPLLAERDLAVTFHSDGPVPIRGDRAHLDRVIINLLGNAVKFTEDGGRVECRAEVADGEAILVVSDSGIGIPEDEQEALFQRFFRSSTSQRMAIPGTGLGLSIVAATVAAHGGRIDVRSADREGTTFTVRLPLARG